MLGAAWTATFIVERSIQLWCLSRSDSYARVRIALIDAARRHFQARPHGCLALGPPPAADPEPAAPRQVELLL